MKLVINLKLLILHVITSVSSRDAFLYSVCVYAPEKSRLEELKGKLASPSLKSSAMQMYPIDFEKVGQKCSETSAAHSAEATDRLAAQC